MLVLYTYEEIRMTITLLNIFLQNFRSFFSILTDSCFAGDKRHIEYSYSIEDFKKLFVFSEYKVPFDID